MPSDDTSLPAIPGAWMIWGAVAGVGAIALLMYREGLYIDPRAFSLIPFYCCGALAIGLCVGLRDAARREHRLVRDLAEYWALGTLIAVVGAVASYPAAAATHGFVDPALARADAALGFDWLAWYRVVADHPMLQVAGRIAYDSIFWMPAAILAAFAWDGRRDRARALIATLALAAALTLVVFRLAPAVGPLSYEWHGPLPYVPESAQWQQALIPPLRQHSFHLVDVGSLRGLVSFPSFHTAAAVMFIAAAWPMRRLRWPVLAVNAAMLLSTPVEGTHYLVDMIAGGAIAGIALALVGRLQNRLARRPVRGSRGMQVAARA